MSKSFNRTFTTHDKVCDTCGVKFKSKRSDARVCSTACRVWKCKKGIPLAGPRDLSPRQQRYEEFTFCG